MIGICIGKVDYKSLDEITGTLQNLKHFTHLNSKNFFNSTLTKRLEFSHEAEVRIIYSAGLTLKMI